MYVNWKRGKETESNFRTTCLTLMAIFREKLMIQITFFFILAKKKNQIAGNTIRRLDFSIEILEKLVFNSVVKYNKHFQHGKKLQKQNFKGTQFHTVL